VLALNQDVRINKAHSIGTCPVTDPLHVHLLQPVNAAGACVAALMRRMASEKCVLTKHRQQCHGASE
jgi:hypothetical protein